MDQRKIKVMIFKTGDNQKFVNVLKNEIFRNIML